MLVVVIGTAGKCDLSPLCLLVTKRPPPGSVGIMDCHSVFGSRREVRYSPSGAKMLAVLRGRFSGPIILLLLEVALGGLLRYEYCIGRSGVKIASSALAQQLRR